MFDKNLKWFKTNFLNLYYFKTYKKLNFLAKYQNFWSDIQSILKLKINFEKFSSNPICVDFSSISIQVNILSKNVDFSFNQIMRFKCEEHEVQEMLRNFMDSFITSTKMREKYCEIKSK